MNYSNALSASRFLLAVPLCYALYNGDRVWIIILALVAGLTDFLDGYLARRFDEVSETGKILDPIADKVLVGACAVTIFLSGRIEWWFLMVIMTRDLLILLGGIFVRRVKGVTLVSNMVGKYTVGIVALSLMFIALDVADFKEELIAASLGALIISFVVYMVNFFRVVFTR